MLFGYPAAANANNWLHDCLFAILDKIHTDIIGGATSPAWPDVIPAAHREQLKRKPGLRSRVHRYQAAFEGLSAAERLQVHECLAQQNQLDQLFAGTAHCRKISQLALAIREPAKDLFIFVFKSLKEFQEIRDLQYRTIFYAIRDKVCPFCGLERFEVPGAVREELDHYLPKATYPFAAVNLWNLVPMCHRCNTGYKKELDLLWKGTTRRLVINPFTHGEIELSLINSPVSGGTLPYRPKWNPEFLPICPGLDTWKQVFSINNRYVKLGILDGHYDNLISDVASWCQATIGRPPNGPALANAMTPFMHTLRNQRRKDHAFIKFSIAELIQRQCNLGNDAIIRPIITCIENLV